MQDRSVAISDPIRLSMIDVCTNVADNVFVCDSKSVYEGGTDMNYREFFTAPDGWSLEAMARC